LSPGGGRHWLRLLVVVGVGGRAGPDGRELLQRVQLPGGSSDFDILRFGFGRWRLMTGRHVLVAVGQIADEVLQREEMEEAKIHSAQ